MAEQLTKTPEKTSLPVGMLKACRPKQWPKNVLVFVAPAAAGVITEPYRLKLTVIGFICSHSQMAFRFNNLLPHCAPHRPGNYTRGSPKTLYHAFSISLCTGHWPWLAPCQPDPFDAVEIRG